MSQSPKVSFYPLEREDPDALILIGCRLTEKAFRLNHRVHLHTESTEQANRLDELLWQYRPESFLPHINIDKSSLESPGNYKITIGLGINMPARPEVLINLANLVWDGHSEFSDIRELVAADESGRSLGRQRYRHYKNLGYPIETLKP